MIKVVVGGVNATLTKPDKSDAGWPEAKKVLLYPNVEVHVTTVIRLDNRAPGFYHVPWNPSGMNALHDFGSTMCGEAGFIQGWAKPEDLLFGACPDCVVAVADALS